MADNLDLRDLERYYVYGVLLDTKETLRLLDYIDHIGYQPLNDLKADYGLADRSLVDTVVATAGLLEALEELGTIPVTDDISLQIIKGFSFSPKNYSVDNKDGQSLLGYKMVDIHSHNGQVKITVHHDRNDDELTEQLLLLLQQSDIGVVSHQPDLHNISRS